MLYHCCSGVNGCQRGSTVAYNQDIFSSTPAEILAVSSAKCLRWNNCCAAVSSDVVPRATSMAKLDWAALLQPPWSHSTAVPPTMGGPSQRASFHTWQPWSRAAAALGSPGKHWLSQLHFLMLLSAMPSWSHSPVLPNDICMWRTWAWTLVALVEAHGLSLSLLALFRQTQFHQKSYFGGELFLLMQFSLETLNQTSPGCPWALPIWGRGGSSLPSHGLQPKIVGI